MGLYPMLSDAFGYCYSDGGHTFYVLTFPSGNATWVYDATTAMWHERSTWTGESLERSHTCKRRRNGAAILSDRQARGQLLRELLRDAPCGRLAERRYLRDALRRLHGQRPASRIRKVRASTCSTRTRWEGSSFTASCSTWRRARATHPSGLVPSCALSW